MRVWKERDAMWRGRRPGGRCLCKETFRGSHIWRMHKGGWGVQKCTKFADKQYIICGQRGAREGVKILWTSYMEAPIHKTWYRDNRILRQCPILTCFFVHSRYTVEVKIEEQQPYRQRTYTWCWAFPPRCSKYKIQIRKIYRTEVRER